MQRCRYCSRRRLLTEVSRGILEPGSQLPPAATELRGQAACRCWREEASKQLSVAAAGGEAVWRGAHCELLAARTWLRD